MKGLTLKDNELRHPQGESLPRDMTGLFAPKDVYGCTCACAGKPHL